MFKDKNQWELNKGFIRSLKMILRKLFLLVGKKRVSDIGKPVRCVDPVMKFCQECRWGWVKYLDCVETREDLEGCTFESGCTLGYVRGRPEDEPTEEELKELKEWCDSIQNT